MRNRRTGASSNGNFYHRLPFLVFLVSLLLSHQHRALAQVVVEAGEEISRQSPDFSNVVCPVASATFAGQTVNGKDPVRRYTEISGLALSPTQLSPSTNNSIMYVVNDGNDDLTGDGGRIGVYDSGTGERLITLVIPNTTLPYSYDWEALAIGSCGHQDDLQATCLYIADVGDNVARYVQGRRSDRTDNSPYRIIKIKEPNIYDLPIGGRDNVTISVLSILPFDYQHSSSPTPFADCEAIFVDSTGWGEGSAVGDVYIVTKWDSDTVNYTRLFQIPAIAWLGEEQQKDDKWMPHYSPMAIGNYDMPKAGDTMGSLRKHTWTGADMTRDGTIIALSDYYGTSLFLRCPGATVAETLTGSAQSCLYFDHASPGQVETSAWNADGTQLLQIPEGSRPLMGWTSVVYHSHDIFLRAATQAESLHVCPRLEWVYWGEGEMYCRSKSDLSVKPNEWCYFASYTLDVVFEQVDPPQTRPPATTSTSWNDDSEDGLPSSGILPSSDTPQETDSGGSHSFSWQLSFLQPLGFVVMMALLLQQ